MRRRSEFGTHSSTPEESTLLLRTVACRDRSISDDVFGECVQLFGEEGTVELSIICGYYSVVSFAFNVAAVPLPEGVPARRTGERSP